MFGGISKVLRGISETFPAAAGHLVMAKNVQNVRVDPGRVRLDLELYLGAWRWVGSRVWNFFPVQTLFFQCFMMPTLSVGYKQSVRSYKQNVWRYKQSATGYNQNFENLKNSIENFEHFENL